MKNKLEENRELVGSSRLASIINNSLYSEVDTSLVRQAETPTDLTPGIHFRYFEFSEPEVDIANSVDGLTGDRAELVCEGCTTNITLEECDGASLRKVNFGIIFSGYIDVPADGLFTFALASTDGSTLHIGDQRVVDNDGMHRLSMRVGEIGLNRGMHAFTLKCFQHYSFGDLELMWSGPGIGPELVHLPESVFHTERDQTNNIAAPFGRVELKAEDAAGGCFDGKSVVSSAIAPEHQVKMTYLNDATFLVERIWKCPGSEDIRTLSMLDLEDPGFDIQLSLNASRPSRVGEFEGPAPLRDIRGLPASKREGPEAVMQFVPGEDRLPLDENPVRTVFELWNLLLAPKSEEVAIDIARELVKAISTATREAEGGK